MSPATRSLLAANALLLPLAGWLWLTPGPEVEDRLDVDTGTAMPAETTTTTTTAPSRETSTTSTTHPTTTTTSTTTTTTVPPTTTTTTTAPPAPAESLEQIYARCGRGYATGLEVVTGDISYTQWDRTIQIAENQLDSPYPGVACWGLAHEDGHAYAMSLAPGDYDLEPPGWPYDGEQFADCYAEVIVGTELVTGHYGCPDLELARSLM